MAVVKVLQPGYARWETPSRLCADGTVTLIRSSVNIIVDTGLPRDKQTIIGELKAEGIGPTDIAFVVCTHGHSDHVGNNNLFPDATFIVSSDICRGDSYTIHDFSHPYVIDEDVQVILTPGHTGQDVSVIVRTTPGVVAVAGDLFENEDDLPSSGVRHPFSEYPEKQRENQEMIIHTVDYIVPGHGDIFVIKRACDT